ncbi:FAD:protein FMN transferase [Arthrobacter sp. H-02-3]|uniref:FAD:protein FMN transferase n=1 Tax=Arthrobacter sp. H-02-3 TaxID=2703675 RepID=UPI000DD1A25C|nr:FAD:protein FMN transferase [Arthrobacter sp. H-02-3]PVZ56964.1 thiamine biosynthesis protein ApbE [Arthrobacter sp. H-02-3]
MGTVISLTVPAGAAVADHELDAAVAAVERVFARLDESFSLYRPDSEASRLARGELSLREASAGMRDRYADAVGWRLMTEGAFSPERPDGVLDLSGLIKGYAIAKAGETLQSQGITDWCLNAGGDVLVMGSPVPGSGASWAAGVVDPQDRTALLSAFELGGPADLKTGTRRALATSGSAERGDHIWTAGAGGAEFTQVSVAAADIVTADVLATAIVAGGTAMLHRATDGWEIDVLAVRRDGELLATPGFRA